MLDCEIAQHEHMTEKEELKAQLKQDELKMTELRKKLEKKRKQEQRKGAELLAAYVDLVKNEDTIKEMKTGEKSLQHKMEKLKQGIL